MEEELSKVSGLEVVFAILGRNAEVFSQASGPGFQCARPLGP